MTGMHAKGLGKGKMVKLFIGNLASTVDGKQLSELFTQFCTVVECDVLKNFAFVHVDTEKEAEEVIQNLDNFVLEGRPMHIERSTSRLRVNPGMSTVCFRCGSNEHKTPSCPLDKGEESVRRRPPKNASPSNGSKRGPPRDFSEPFYPPAKRMGDYGSNYDYRAANYYAPPAAYGRPDDYYSRPAAPRQEYYATQPMGFTDPTTRERYDPVLPRPQARELENVYSQYVDSRQRYFYFREQLFKEMMARGESVTATNVAHAYPQPTPPQPQAPVVRYPEVFYNQPRPAAPAAAPYTYPTQYAANPAAPAQTQYVGTYPPTPQAPRPY